MHHKLVMTSNVVKAFSAMEELFGRSQGEEGMGLLYGRPGEGKTTCITALTNRFNGVFLRANVTWTVTSMLQAFMTELELEPAYRRAPMISSAIEVLGHEQRPIIIDEADYLLRQTDMLDALRDIYDMTGVPVLMVMMEVAPRKIKTSQRLSRFRRRITQWIEFDGQTLDDTRKVASELAEIHVGDDLIARIHEEAEANIGHVVIALANVERFAKANDLDAVTLSDYGKRSLFGGREMPA